MAPSPTTAPSRAWDLWLTENVEALAIAVAMALILKFFVVEAYQIPTGSMQPTILGDATAGIHDRILADKAVTLFRDPRRWEVMIFRFPLDERRLYVKRIVGLPDETLEILGGDVWVDGAIARKPDHVNESVLKSTHGAEPMDVGRWFASEGDVRLVGTEAQLGPAGGALDLRHDVQDDFLDGYDPDWGIPPASSSAMGARNVPDLDLTARVTPGSGSETLTIAFDAGSERVRFVLPVGASGRAFAEVVPDDGGAPRRFDAQVEGALAPDAAATVQARSVDRRLILRVDGDEWLRADDDAAGPRPETPRAADVRVALDGPGTVADLHLRRDIFYLPHSNRRMPDGARWEIPAGHYFGLGDNTQSSHDSRSWQTVTYHLADGRTITGFSFENPRAPDRNPRRVGHGEFVFADVHGDAIRFHEDEVLRATLEDAPFIPAENLLGKASVVFWPVIDPFRWKLIR